MPHESCGSRSLAVPCPRAGAPLCRHRRRPGRADRRLPPGQGGQARHRPRGRRPGRRPREDRRRPRRLPLRPRRPPLLHEEQGGQRPLARDHGRRVPHAPAHVAHLLARASSSTTRSSGTDVVKKLGPIELSAAACSYLWAAIKPKGREDNLEQWVSNRFGKRLYNHFFKSYTEKVWGVPTHRAARRVGRPAHQGPVVLQRRQGRLLRQPRQQDQVADRPVPVPALRPGPDVGADDDPHRGARRRGPARDAGRRSIEVDSDGDVIAVHTHDEVIEPKAVISSLPLRATVGIADPQAPAPRSARPPRACATATS